MDHERRHSAACERNQGPIGDELDRILRPGDLLWEIGSGTGQHAAYFGARFPYIVWQPSDWRENHASIRAWVADGAAENVREPLAFDLFDDLPAVERANVVFCANTIHIAPWPATAELFRHAARALVQGGSIVTYGPYRFRDTPLEPSNRQFDEWLKSVDPQRGIRTFEDVDELAREAGFTLVEDVSMPSNNHLLRWKL